MNGIRREVVVGVHSRAWRMLAAPLQALGCTAVAIGHRDVAGFAFRPDDRVWVLSWSRRAAGNTVLLHQLAASAAAELVYVSSASTIVGERTACYAYPRLKRRAEREALALPHARVLTIGLLHDDGRGLPAGDTIATSCHSLARFIAAPDWGSAGDTRRTLLFERVRRPHATRLEAGLHRGYDQLLLRSGRFPCLLRPLDLLLRACGLRWYGYVGLSNQLWTSTTSS